MRNLQSWRLRDVRVIDHRDERFGQIGVVADFGSKYVTVFVQFDDAARTLMYTPDQLELV